MVSARRAWSCHLAECDVITRGDEDYSCQETSCQDKLSRLQLSRGRPCQSVSKFAEAKADDDADTERLPPEPSSSPNSGYARESYNLRQRLCSWLRRRRQRAATSTPLHPPKGAPPSLKIVQENTSQIQSENFSTLQPVVNIDKWTTTFSPSPSSRTSSGEAR